MEEAAREQDTIGWKNFTEGKISAKWRELQEQCRRKMQSRRAARRWAQNLVSLLLELVHGQWMFTNSIVHEKDAQGLKAAEGQQPVVATEEQRWLGKDGLHHWDHHSLKRKLESIMGLPAMEQRQWAQAIQLARATCAEQAGSSLHWMRTFMETWMEQG